LGKAEASAEELLAAGHSAAIGFVVVAGQVQEAVQDEDFDFGGKRMALFGSLAERRGYADGHIAGDPLRTQTFRRERQDVRRFVLAPEAAIEFANGRVGGQEHRDLPLEPQGLLRRGEKTGQSSGGGQTEVGGF
jgi:hypothetical protein